MAPTTAPPNPFNRVDQSRLLPATHGSARVVPSYSKGGWRPESGEFLCAQLLRAPLPELAQHRRNSPNPAGCIMLVGIPISKRKMSELCPWLKQPSFDDWHRSALWHLVPGTQDWEGRLEAQQAGLVCTDRSPSDPPAGSSPVPGSQEGLRLNTELVRCQPGAPGTPVAPAHGPHSRA